MKLSFIVLAFLKHIPVEMITALFKYFKKVEPTASESAQASGLKEVEKDEVQKQLQSVKEPQPKKKDNAMVIMTSAASRNSKWGIAHGVRPEARKFGVP